MGVRRYHQANDGEPIKVARVDKSEWALKLACCDCGLVHKVLIEHAGVELTMRAWRDPRATAAKRRKRQLRNSSRS